ncbi:hypothetical protein ZIOFF_025355 [Zingiber officinale]|uniref:Uncharacterized protein n=1 Tax=Zingiber officinale TaxID=94328 RepID=A0A8J5H3K2_ZINOF|nr:hypothetical protein ZIOFF_025355 [Zingiber officinale]
MEQSENGNGLKWNEVWTEDSVVGGCPNRELLFWACLDSARIFQKIGIVSFYRRSRISEEEINELISNLQFLLQDTHQRRRGSSRASPENILHETCNCIKKLHQEVDDLSNRLSALMETMDFNSAQVELLQSFFHS